MPRVVDDVLVQQLSALGAVLIEGAKACGKTETARRVARSELRVDVDPTVSDAMALDPALLLEGARPRLIDEWQLEPTLWNHVRRAVDDAPGKGQFVLTGSSRPADDVRRHSGAGRFATLSMRPMSTFEMRGVDVAVSLRGLFEGSAPRAVVEPLDVDALAELVVIGGWPENLDARAAQAADYCAGYLENVAHVDIQGIGGVTRDPVRVERLLRSLARNVATEAKDAVLVRDTGGTGPPISPHTVADYLDALRRIHVLTEVPAWAPRLRSKATLRSSPKRHLVDPSLAAAALDAGPSRLRAQLDVLGLLVESLAVRDLLVLATPLRGRVHHYRDSYGNEVDAVVQLPDGRWGAVEVKLGVGRLEEAKASLRRFVDQLDAAAVPAPSFLAVIVGNAPYAYVDDGVAVIPLAALGP